MSLCWEYLMLVTVFKKLCSLLEIKSNSANVIFGLHQSKEWKSEEQENFLYS